MGGEGRGGGEGGSCRDSFSRSCHWEVVLAVCFQLSSHEKRAAHVLLELVAKGELDKVDLDELTHFPVILF